MVKVEVVLDVVAGRFDSEKNGVSGLFIAPAEKNVEEVLVSVNAVEEAPEARSVVGKVALLERLHRPPKDGILGVKRLKLLHKSINLR